MSGDTMTDIGAGHVLGRKPKSTTDDIILVAWSLFERSGFESTTMSDIATAVGISRRTLFNYFASKEALLFPAVDEYMAEFGRLLMDRPAGEQLFVSLEHCLENSSEMRARLDEKFNPGPAVLAARLSDSAVRYSRDYWAREMERIVALKLSGMPGADMLAGFVGALAAQFWTEAAKKMKTSGNSADMQSALDEAMSVLKMLVG